jgi:hypothetical protein
MASSSMGMVVGFACFFGIFLWFLILVIYMFLETQRRPVCVLLRGDHNRLLLDIEKWMNEKGWKTKIKPKKGKITIRDKYRNYTYVFVDKRADGTILVSYAIPGRMDWIAIHARLAGALSMNSKKLFATQAVVPELQYRLKVPGKKKPQPKKGWWSDG